MAGGIAETASTEAGAGETAEAGTSFVTVDDAVGGGGEDGAKRLEAPVEAGLERDSGLAESGAKVPGGAAAGAVRLAGASDSSLSVGGRRRSQ